MYKYRFSYHFFACEGIKSEPLHPPAGRFGLFPLASSLFPLFPSLPINDLLLKEPRPSTISVYTRHTLEEVHTFVK